MPCAPWLADAISVWPKVGLNWADSLGSDPDRLVAHSGLANALQFATEEPANASGRTVNGGEQVRVGFPDRNPPKRPQLGADPALMFAAGHGGNSNCNLSHAVTKTSESKQQSSLDIALYRFDQGDILKAKIHLHSFTSISSLIHRHHKANWAIKKTT